MDATKNNNQGQQMNASAKLEGRIVELLTSEPRQTLRYSFTAITQTCPWNIRCIADRLEVPYASAYRAIIKSSKITRGRRLVKLAEAATRTGGICS